ncbi:hypothetical protein BU23DRAFT_317744, partial [Bimuria novae-zelandiae CBS 107.79]
PVQSALCGPQAVQFKALDWTGPPIRNTGDDIGNNWHVGDCVKELGKIAGSNLKELSIRLRHEVNHLFPIKHFNAFTVLKTLEVDIILLDHTIGHETLMGSSTRLADMLPASIHKVTLHLKKEDPIKCIDHLLVRGVSPAQPEKLTNLEEIVIRNYVNGVGGGSGEASRRAPEDYAATKALAENESIHWIDDELNPWWDQWDGWTSGYCERFGSTVEYLWFFDEDQDEDEPTVPGCTSPRLDSPRYSPASPYSPSSQTDAWSPTSPTYSPVQHT